MKNTDENFAKLCRDHGWRRTPQRQAVYEYMSGNTDHPSVDAVWSSVRRQVPSVTRESIYRILNEFAEAGFITRLDKFENARYDSRTGPHIHFMCEKCRKITDFPLSSFPQPPPELAGFLIHHTEYRISGICAACRAAAEKERQFQKY